MEGETLSDHLGRLKKDGRRNRDAKGLGGLKVDDQVELFRPLDRNSGRPGRCAG